MLLVLLLCYVLKFYVCKPFLGLKSCYMLAYTLMLAYIYMCKLSHKSDAFVVL